MGKFICPFCYEQHDFADCGLKCSFNIPGTNKRCVEKNEVKKDAYDWIGNEQLDGTYVGIAKTKKEAELAIKNRRQKIKCMKCTHAKKQVFCPTNGVNREIPLEFSTDTNLPIALIGAKASGKSNYIGVLINEIRKKMCGAFRCSLDISCDQISKEYYDEFYYKPLFNLKSVVEATTSATEIPPMIFPLRFLDKNGRLKKNSGAILTFYDSAGENFDTENGMLVFNRYIPNSKGIILLLDPLQIPSIRKQLEGKMPLPEQNTDVVEILSRVIQNIRDVKNIKGTINIPLALAFTKMDALETHGLLPDGSCLKYESEHMARGAFVKSDFENTNIEMTSILENWLDAELLNMMGQFSKWSIFGLSALGGIPNRNKLSTDEISPRRVLDPLLWILAENKFIDRVK